MSSHDEVKLTERQWALTAAAQAFCNRGITIACPWEGDLDDKERDRFEALVSAIDSYSAILSPGAIPSTGSGETVPAAWRYRYKTDRTGDAWDEWMVVTVDPNDWDWAPAWHDFECQPLYASPANPAETQAVEVGK